MLERDLGANGILSHVAMFEHEIAAGKFHVADEAWRRIDAGLLAHETDRAVAVDRDALGRGQAGPKAIFHARISSWVCWSWSCWSYDREGALMQLVPEVCILDIYTHIEARDEMAWI